MPFFPLFSFPLLSFFFLSILSQLMLPQSSWSREQLCLSIFEELTLRPSGVGLTWQPEDLGLEPDSIPTVEALTSGFTWGSSRSWLSLPEHTCCFQKHFSYPCLVMEDFISGFPRVFVGRWLEASFEFCRNFSSTRQVLRGGCRLDFTSTSVLFIFAS